VKYMMTACPCRSVGRLLGGSSADAWSCAAREHAIIDYLYGKRD
jgi:hypothetical protein